jgi:hypothetical protein
MVEGRACSALPHKIFSSFEPKVCRNRNLHVVRNTENFSPKMYKYYLEGVFKYCGLQFLASYAGE